MAGRQLAQMDDMHFLMDMLDALFKNEIIAQKDQLCMNGIPWCLFLRNYIYTFFLSGACVYQVSEGKVISFLIVE